MREQEMSPGSVGVSKALLKAICGKVPEFWDVSWAKKNIQ